MPNADTYLNQPPVFEWYVVTRGCKIGHHIDMCRRDWTKSSTFGDCSRFSSQHNWGWLTWFIKNENSHFDTVFI